MSWKILRLLCAAVAMTLLPAVSAQAAPITVVDASFEVGGAAQGDGQAIVSPWSAPGDWGYVDGSNQPGGLSATDGNWYVYSNGNDSIYQTLAATLQPNTTYSLSVDVGARNDQGMPGYSISLSAGGNSLTSVSGGDSSFGPGWITAVATYTTPASVTPGQALQISLGGYGVQTEFDNVRLDATATSTPLYWAGGAADGNWSTVTSGTSNWTSDSAGTVTGSLLPSSSNNVCFTTTGGTNLTTTLGATSFTVFSVNFNASATSPVTINSTGGTLTINGGGVNVDPASADHVINAPVALGASKTWTISGTRTLTVNGPISGSSDLTAAGTGTLLLAGTNSYNNTIITNGSTVQVGKGGASGTLGGGAVANNGSLVFSRNDTYPFANSISGEGSVTVGGGGTLVLTGTAAHSGGTTVNPSSTLQIGDGTTNGSIGSVVNNGSVVFHNGSDQTYSGVISTTSGPGNVAKTGNGTLTLTAQQTYTGKTTISGGVVKLQGRSTYAVTVGDPSFEIGGAASLLPGGVNHPLASPWSSPDFWGYQNGTFGGVSATNGSWVAFANGNGNASQTLVATLQPNTTYSLSVDVGARNDLGMPGYSISLSAGGNSLTSASGGDSSFGPGWITAVATYTTPASVTPGQTLQISLGGYGVQTEFDNVRLDATALGGVSNLLPSSTPLTITSAGTLDLNSVSQQVASLSGAGSVINGGNADAMLTISGGSSTVFSGVISDGLSKTALTISGGTQTLSGLNTYSGGTVVNGGALLIGVAGALPSSTDLTINGGTLDTQGFAQTINSLTMSSSGTLNLHVGSILRSTGLAAFDGTLNVNLTGLHGGKNTLMTYGSYSGSLSYTPPPGYSLSFAIPGELDLIGGSSVWAAAVSESWTGSSNWTGGEPNSPGAGAVINPPTSSDLTITLDGPKTVGTLEFGNAGSPTHGYSLSGASTDTLTLNNNGTTSITVTDGKHAIDVPVVLENDLVVSGSGTLTFSSSITENGGVHSLTMSGTGGTLILSGTGLYTGGTIVNAGTLAVTSSTALPDNQSLTVGAGGTLIFDPSYSGSSIIATPVSPLVVSPVPEPGTLALLAAGAVAGFVAWRRRKGLRA